MQKARPLSRPDLPSDGSVPPKRFLTTRILEDGTIGGIPRLAFGGIAMAIFPGPMKQYFVPRRFPLRQFWSVL